MARSKKKNYTVKTENKLTWDDLRDTSDEVRNALITVNQKLMQVYEMYKDYIEGDEEITKIYNGISLALQDIVKKYNDAVALHSIKNPDGTLVPYTGDIDENDDKQIELYMSLTLLYSGIANEITAFTNTSITALMTKIEAKLREEMTKENNDGNESTTKSESNTGNNKQ